MALDDVKVSVAEYPTKPESIPEGQIGFVKSDKSILVNHGNGEVVEYGGKAGIYRGPGTIEKSTLRENSSSNKPFVFIKGNDNKGFFGFGENMRCINAAAFKLPKVTGKHPILPGVVSWPIFLYGGCLLDNGVVYPEPNWQHASSFASKAFAYSGGASSPAAGENVAVNRAATDKVSHNAEGLPPWITNIAVPLQLATAFAVPTFMDYGYLRQQYRSGPGPVLKTRNVDLTEPYNEGTRFVGAVLVADQNMCVMVPFDANYVQEFDMTYSTPLWGTFTKTALVQSANVPTRKFIGGCLLPNGKVMFTPYNHPCIGLYDPKTKTYEDGPAHGKTGGKSFRGAYLLDNGLVVMGARDSGCIGLYDYMTNKYHDGPEMPILPLGPTGAACVFGNTVLFSFRPDSQGQPTYTNFYYYRAEGVE
jgi:hypothetical protein